jgi:hypothetical protein
MFSFYIKMEQVKFMQKLEKTSSIQSDISISGL